MDHTVGSKELLTNNTFLDLSKSKLFVLGMFMNLVGYVMAFEFSTLILISTLTIFFSSSQQIRAIQTSRRKKKDTKPWLIYWMVFCTFSAFDFCVGFLLEHFLTYCIARFLFLVWVLVPEFNGARLVYENVLRPMFKANQSMVMGLIKKTHEVTAKATTDITKSVNEAQSKLEE